MTERWRADARLRGRFHPEYPDDLQVLVHDGGPRITDRAPEVVWVRVSGSEGDAFLGRVLNQPVGLTGVREGDVIRFVACAGAPHPVMVTGKYLRERPDWEIIPCNRCGFDELFDAPSDLMRIVFPDAPQDAVMEMFTSFCPLCGGAQVIQARGAAGSDMTPQPPPAGAKKPWWKLW